MLYYRKPCHFTFSGTSVDEAPSSSVDPPSPPASPATPASSPSAPAAAPVTPVTPGEVEEVLLKDVAPKAQAMESGLRQRGPTVTSSTSSEGSLGRVQVTIRYSQPRGKLVVVVHKCV